MNTTKSMLRATALAGLSAILSPLALAAQADISSTPLSSVRSVQVKPNIMLLMDTSVSMGYTHMPDEVETTASPTSVGYKNYQCNALYYNPNTAYGLPRNSDGTFFPSQTNFNAVPYDAFDTTSLLTINLGTNFRAYETGLESGSSDVTRKSLFYNSWPVDGASGSGVNSGLAAYYYVYTGSETLTYSTSPCTITASTDPTVLTQTTPGGGTWKRVTVSATSGPGNADERTNFANWYAYYRKRMLLTKTAVSLSFNPLNNSYRVGLITVQPNINSPSYPQVNSDKFLAINDFAPGAGNQRDLWYAKLFSQKPAGSSPAREGLARVGRYYANKFDGINAGMGSADPIQYSCQKNFTIMTTDGYWNAQTETPGSALGGGYLGGPVQIDGKSWVANSTSSLNPDGTLTTASDGVVPFGVYDGGQNSVTTSTDRLDTFSTAACVGNAPYVTNTTTLSSTQVYTATTSQTTRTKQQNTTGSVNYTLATDQYQTRTWAFTTSTQQYTTQTLNYKVGTTQQTKTTTPFTTKVTTLYTSGQSQLTETTSQVQETDTAWTKKVSTSYTTGQTQSLATTSQQMLSTYTTQSTQTQQSAQTYQIIRVENESGTAVDSCTPSSTVVCQKQIKTAWTPVASCTSGTTGTPNYVVTECQTATIQAAHYVSSCTSGQTGSPDYITTTCTQSTPTTAVPSTCTANSQASSSPFTTSVCNKVILSGPSPVDTSSTACTTNTTGSPNYITTTCTQGPMTVAAAPSAQCTAGATHSGSPNYVNTVCSATPTTNYVSSTTSCSNQTASTSNGGVGIVCTAGTVTLAHYVATCTNGTTGSGSTTKDVTCSGPLNVTSSHPQACTHGASFNTGTPNFTQYTCTSATIQATAASPACTAGTTYDSNNIGTTCSVAGPTTTYLAAASSCTVKTANSATPGETTTCTTPAPTGPVDAACAGNTVTGTGASQATITCGSRVLTAPTAIQICTPGVTTSGTGVVTTCTLTLGTATGIASCTPGDTLGTTPPYTGSRCNNNVTTNVPSPSCTVGDSGKSGPSYIDTVCSQSTPTGWAQAPAPCTTGTTVGSTSPFTYTQCQDLSPTPPTALNGTCTPGVTQSGGVWTTCAASVVTAAGTPTPSCTPGSTTLATSPFTVTTCVDTFAASPSAFVSQASACTGQAKTSVNNYTSITCSTSTPVVAPSGPCTPGTTYGVSPSFIKNVCATTVPTTPASANCSPGVSYDNSTGITTTCTASVTTATAPSNCSPAPATAVNNWTTTSCTTGPAAGTTLTYGETQTITTYKNASSTVVSTTVSPTTQIVPTGTSYPGDGGVCHIPAVNPLVVPSPTRPSSTGNPSCTAWPCATTASTGEGSYNSLADVAQYYYATDLRPEYPNTGPQSVPTTASGPLDDRVSWQHMTTFTVALGVSGTMTYDPAYRTASTGDFAQIVAGTKSWPQWPDPTIDYVSDFTQWENPRSIDDFWHTAVNGRGQYFSAGDPRSVASGIAGALSQIDATSSAGAAAGTSTSSPVAGDNFVFVGSYTTGAWTGDVVASTLDLTTGEASSTILWSAQAKLDAKISAACDSRNIYLMRPGSATTLVPFTWNTFTCGSDGLPVSGSSTIGISTAEQANFDRSHILLLSNAPQMTDGTSGSVDQPTAAAGANLLNYLRGENGHEDFQSGDAVKLYRKRQHVLGDIIGAQPVYVKGPTATYLDTGYSAFATANAGRTPMVYVAANDGMLHAFYAGTSASDPLGGQEAWAVIPSTVLPNLFKLADNNYKNVHQYYVDGTPVAGDVLRQSDNTWKTILVGGLNDGGDGYYALDITNPAAPAALWEFKLSTTCYNAGVPSTAGADCNLGLTFGKPVITKVLDSSYPEGRWVVLLSSGYNNVSGAANDGHGFLYVLDALSGNIIQKIDTGAGTSGTPSNLGQLTAYVDDSSVNNTAVRVYGGDMLGNIWRFDVNDTQDPPGREAALIGQAKDPGGNPQPITTRIEIAELNGKPMVFAGTGRLLGATDVSTTQTQTIYGIVDTLTGNPVYPDLRAALKPMIMTESGSGTSLTRTVACSTATADATRCGSSSGWLIDLPDSGERLNVNMSLVLNTLVAGTNVPDVSACSTGGFSWLNYIDFASGTSNGSFGGTVASGSTGATGNGALVSQYLTGSLIVGLGVIRLPDGQFKTLLRTSGSEGTPPVTGLMDKDLFPSTPAPQGKRISWREIAQ